MPEPISLILSDSDEAEEAVGSSLARRLKARGACSALGSLSADAEAEVVNLTDSEDECPAPTRKRLRKVGDEPSKPLAAQKPTQCNKGKRPVQKKGKEDGAAPSLLMDTPSDAPVRAAVPPKQPGSGRITSKDALLPKDAPEAATRAAPTKQQQQTYLATRRAGVKARRFNLSSVTSGTVSTARTIKPMTAWSGLWPALRELMQNTIDHLQLLGPDGQLNAALDMEHSTGPAGERMVRFSCGRGTDVCAIKIECDELVIEQAFTFPLHHRALDTGVSDRTKGGESTAGGFGDGFKTAAISLLAQPSLAASLAWHFEAEETAITWDFVGAHRPAVGTYRASQVLEVRVKSERLETPHPGCQLGTPPSAHRMVQVVHAKGIGAAFTNEAMARLQVFWQLSPTNLLSTRNGGSF
eukprot:CAMPEP_0119306968 /NCGR_PEP_ID=MMETSP1333-20130426/7590_1 /TAXON_ID=418940 /ORGANISM="Scyphosphaera apsteinii, Strain RCC1455" /LENGTH=410 /DNA_ID=CAMNT_0007310411 /DNA_START=99 /DNA_END=1328 /DNA_ORIENTATION=-